jgi:hypothetical protein
MPKVDVAPMEAFTQSLARRKTAASGWKLITLGGGFCLLIKRQLLDQIGPLEAKTCLNIFDALSLKMRRAGYSLAGCKDLFIPNSASRG